MGVDIVNSTLTNNEFKLFREYIEETCGINISEDKSYLIEIRLSKILADSGLKSFEELFHSIIKNNNYLVTEKIIDAITTNETLWFRDKSPWDILEEQLMPKFIEELRSKKKNKIRIWSAASSTGQEAYSTAMCIDNYLLRNRITDINLNHFEILGTDISKNVLEIARNARYDPISVMRGLDIRYKNTYFHKNGTVWQLDEKIKNIVKFKNFNLQKSFLVLGDFDIVFCRYVLIYFSVKLRNDIFSRLVSSIRKDGTFFLGSSEIYSNIEEYFKLLRYNNGIYYKRKVDII
jgi:chemotaxis protein methyltransferase CheR